MRSLIHKRHERVNGTIVSNTNSSSSRPPAALQRFFSVFNTEMMKTAGVFLLVRTTILSATILLKRVECGYVPK
uniref:Uncharacterized protein n=1 Tax=Parascaris equorum TaxID=6256 RepID=A0A914RDZ7_PAREQ